MKNISEKYAGRYAGNRSGKYAAVYPGEGFHAVKFETGGSRPTAVRSSDSRARSRAGVLLIALSIAVTLLTMAGLSAMTASGVPTYAPVSYYRIVTVHANDTLWDIASANTEQAELPVRELVDNIMKVNQLRSPRIYTGQQLAVPCRGIVRT